MRYEIDINSVKKHYQIKENKLGLTHKTGNSIRLLPYTIGRISKDSKPMFRKSIGSFSRKIIKKSLDIPFDGNEYLESVLDKIGEIEEITLFKSIVKEMFFNKDGNLEIFHPKVLSYIYTKNIFDKKLGEFLYDVLINGDEETYIAVEKVYKEQPNNVLLKLLVNGLKELKVKDYGSLTYHNCMDEVRTIFKEDFLFIVSDQKVYTESIEKLLKFYYFMYISQTGLKFKRFFDEVDSKMEKIYFNLDWERTSRTRVSYIEGWRKVESAIESVFSHVNCLELLNHNNKDEKMTYVEIKETIDSMNSEEECIFIKNMDNVIRLYKSNLEDVEWDNLKVSSKYSENKLYSKVYELYSAIDYQFNVSKRKDLYKRYRTWFTEFCKESFLKSRGRLGFTLNLTEDYLLFMTKIIIKNNEKMKLKDYFKEFEKRGVFFDRDTRKNIIVLFDKLNILEKKSDSGDAQYVKRVL